MKNYIANGTDRSPATFPMLTRCVENGSWDTSKALVRRTLERCIQLGRQARSGGNKVDTYESYRLLGQAVCILDIGDYAAHLIRGL